MANREVDSRFSVVSFVGEQPAAGEKFREWPDHLWYVHGLTAGFEEIRGVTDTVASLVPRFTRRVDDRLILPNAEPLTIKERLNRGFGVEFLYLSLVYELQRREISQLPRVWDGKVHLSSRTPAVGPGDFVTIDELAIVEVASRGAFTKKVIEYVPLAKPNNVYEEGQE